MNKQSVFESSTGSISISHFSMGPYHAININIHLWKKLHAGLNLQCDLICSEIDIH